MHSFIARQPIFDANLSVFAYELLFRSSFENTFGNANVDEASSKVIADSSLLFDLETLTAGRRAFINLSQDVLLQEHIRLLPSHLAVAEVLETVQPEPEVIEACRSLKEAGYMLALDDFVYEERFAPLVDLADIIKIDLLISSEEEQRDLIKAQAGRPVRFLAEKVETQEAFDKAKAMGYTYFQGYFFCKPVIMTRKDVPGFKLNYLRILNEINRSELDYTSIEAIIKQEMSFSYRLLRYANSSHFAFRAQVETIRRALTLLGENEIKKWVSMTALASMAEDKPDELVVQAVIRGRLCETLAPLFSLEPRSQDLFLMGLFSLIDAILDQPLDEILDSLPIADDIKAALGGQENPVGRVLELVRAHEKGDWECLSGLATPLGLDMDALPALYFEAVQWADAGVRQTGSETERAAALA